MRFVAIGRDRDMLQRHRHLRRGDIAQLVKTCRENLLSPAAKPTRMPGRFERFDQRLKRHDIGEIRAGVFQHAAGRFPGEDFRIAFVAQDHEAEAIGQSLQAREIVGRGHRTLRVRRRGDEDRDRY